MFCFHMLVTFPRVVILKKGHRIIFHLIEYFGSFLSCFAVFKPQSPLFLLLLGSLNMLCFQYAKSSFGNESEILWLISILAAGLAILLFKWFQDEMKENSDVKSPEMTDNKATEVEPTITTEVYYLAFYSILTWSLVFHWPTHLYPTFRIERCAINLLKYLLLVTLDPQIIFVF